MLPAAKPNSRIRDLQDDAPTFIHREGNFAARYLGAAHCAVFARRDIYRRHHRALGRARHRAGALDARRRIGAGLRGDPARARRRHLDLAGGRWRRAAGGDGTFARPRADRLSALSRHQGPTSAGDLRHHHRSDRSAAIRRHRAVAAARRQSGHLCRPLRRRTAAQCLFRYRARRHQFDVRKKLTTPR